MIKASRLALAALGLLLALAAASDVQEEDGVLVLTDDNFDGVIAAHEHILVEFYAPWCGHCKKLAPEYAKAAQALKKQENPVPLAKVDATEQKALADRFEIRGFPTIKFFRKGVPIDYSGGRTESDIVNWVNKKSGPAAHTLNDEADLDKFLEANEVTVIAVVNDASSDVAKAFLDAAAADDSLVFGITTSDAVRSKLNVAAGEEAVVLTKPYDEKRNELKLSASTSAKDITDFVVAHSRPLVQFFTKESAQQIFSSPIQVHLLFFTNKEAEHHDAQVQLFTEAAKGVRGRALVVNIPHSEQRILDFFGVTEADLPAAYIADMRSGHAMKKFKVEGDLTLENIASTAEKFFKGELKPSLKSETPAPEDTTGAVKVVKGKTFEDLVLKNNKNVFVEFYAPWCGHCKKLAPTWEELGEKYKDSSNVVIAKMDATANEIDVEGVEVQGFPTLYFFKAHDKANPIKYDGERELDALTKFVEENSVAVGGSDEL